MRTIAALNHPNVCILYPIGPDYLVMEYIEGATLAGRISEGPIPCEYQNPARWLRSDQLGVSF